MEREALHWRVPLGCSSVVISLLASAFYLCSLWCSVEEKLEKRGTKASFCSGKVSPKKLKS